MLATGVQFSTVHQNAQHRFMLWRDGLRCHGSIYEVGLRTPLKPQLEFSAREHSTNFRSLVKLNIIPVYEIGDGGLNPSGPAS